jgi:hypothetical protein
MNAHFDLDGYQRIERREAVEIHTHHVRRDGEVEHRIIVLQPCDVCGALVGPWWDFVIGGETFTFCGKHRSIGEASDDRGRANRLPGDVRGGKARSGDAQANLFVAGE